MWCGDLLQQLGLLPASCCCNKYQASTLVDERPEYGKSPKLLALESGDHLQWRAVNASNSLSLKDNMSHANVLAQGCHV